MADAESTLRELLENIAEGLSHKQYEIAIKAITSGGANYTSALFLATLKNSDEDLELFAKVAIIGDKMRETMDTIFENEAFVFNELTKIYNGLQEKHDVPTEERFVFPKFYGCNTEKRKETIVLENLIAKGYSAYSRFESIDWEYASGAVESLARFHALSFALSKENPEKFANVVANFKFLGDREQIEQMQSSFQKMIASGLGGVKDKYKQRVEKFLETVADQSNFFEKFYFPTHTSVLIHGDYRPSNLLHRQEGDKVHIIPVDYQTVRNGCPVSDLVYFIFSGSDARFRAEHYERLVEHYFQQLTLALQRLGMDPAEEYPRKQFDSDLKEMLPFGLVLGLALLPIVMVEAAEAPRMDGDASFDNFAVESNVKTAERLTGIIEDFIRWDLI